MLHDFEKGLDITKSINHPIILELEKIGLIGEDITKSLVNYARKFIPHLSKLVGPLYSKTTKNGQRYFNTEDIKLVKQIKEAVKNLKPLELPLSTDYIIIETDGCKTGWGAVLLCKPNKYSSKNSEKVCAYASGRDIRQIQVNF